MASPVNDTGARTFTCGASVVNLDSNAALSLSVRGAEVSLNADEVADAIALLQYVESYQKAAVVAVTPVPSIAALTAAAPAPAPVAAPAPAPGVA